VDVWSGYTWVEQGKIVIYRIGDSTGYDNTWLASALTEWTPERAVLQAVLANANDAYSSERVYITLQRGTVGLTVECYPAPKSGGTPADAEIFWFPAQADA